MKVLAAPSHRREPNLEENSSGADPSPTPAPTGRLREWNGGVPGHGEFVMLKTQPTHAELKSMHTAAAASRRGVGRAILDHELLPTVSGEACTLRQLIRRGTFPNTGTGGHHGPR